MVADFIVENKDAISSFYDYCLETHDGKIGFARWIDGKTTEEVYFDYCKWCEQNGSRVETAKTFTLRFGKKLPGYISKKTKKLSGNVYNMYMVNGGIPSERD